MCVNSVYSDASVLRYGVWQRSVFGPILFVLYMSPLSDVMSRHAMSHVSYADDTQFYQSALFTELSTDMYTGMHR